MTYDKNLLKEFANGATEISTEIGKLLDELPTNSVATPGSPLTKIHKSLVNLAKSAEYTGLENTENFLKQIDAAITAVKDKKIKADNQFVKSIKELLNKFTEIINNKTEEFEELISILSLTEIAQNIGKGIYEDLPKMDIESIYDFIADTEEQISAAEENFLLLSKNGFNQDVVNMAYRNIHTIKGNSGFARLYQLQNLCHAMETIMGGIRDKSIEINNQNISFLLKYLDVIKTTASDLEKGGKGVIKNFDELIENVKNTFPEAFGIKREVISEKIEEKSLPVIKDSTQMKEEINKLIVSDDMFQNFISDSNEQLSTAEEAFLLLKTNGFEQETMNNAYRQIHSFKGNCGFMQFEDLKNISHTMENIMQFMRDKKLPIEQKSISFLLKYLDVLRNGVANIEQTGDTSIPEAEEYIKKAIELFPECFANNPIKTTKEIQIRKQDEVVAKNLTQIPNSNNKNTKRQDFRVDLVRLEKIINLAGELVIAESMVSRNPAVIEFANESLNRSIYHLRRICNDLQDATMSLCMIPLNGLFKKMTRLVYDLSNHIGKKINLITIGEDTEVDKSIFELINDPLVHIIRNACDHGIETPAQRIAAGKSEIGTITISGEHRSGSVWISIKDDGYGFNREKILEKAIEQKFISAKNQLNDDEIFKLVLSPGFTTADIVSDISGRGVGLDVVQKNIESIRGQISISSEEGKGTEFIIKIPLTLAIIDGMVIKSANSSYVIPTLIIKQSLKYDKDFITYSPEHEEILKFQDKLVPILRIENIFNKNINDNSQTGILVVVEENDNLVALFADDIIGQQHIVIKGYSEYMSKTRGTNGCTILGDGTVALILDIKTLMDMALEKAKNKHKRC